MKVESVTQANMNTKKRPLINLKTTGYVAATGIGLSMLSGLTKNRILRKNHKILAGISFTAVVAHIYLIINGHKQTKI